MLYGILRKFVRPETVSTYVILMLIMPVSVFAGRVFTEPEISRLESAKTMLAGIEKRSVNAIAKKLASEDSPRDSLFIYLAIAATFQDISREYQQDDVYLKERLLGKIQMNMAYFQLGGQDIEIPGENELNILIRRKLKKYLPKEVWGNPDLFHSLE